MALQDVLRPRSDEDLINILKTKDHYQLRDILIKACESQTYRAVKLLFDHTEINKDTEFLAGRESEVKKLESDILIAEANLNHMRMAKEILENCIVDGNGGE